MTGLLPPLREVDALVIGAGPVGLWQVFQLGLLGLHCDVVDALPAAGGQCLALYPDKPIYDIPGVPVCTGADLTARLLQQIAPFQPRFHFGHEVSGLQTLDDGRFELTATPSMPGAQPQRWRTRNVYIAAGVGAFQPRRLKLDGAAALEGRQLHYHPDATQDLAGQHVIVHGGDDRALTWAADLADRIAAPPEHADHAPASVTLLYRRDVYPAEPAAIERLLALAGRGLLHRSVGQPTALQRDASGRLHALVYTDVHGVAQHLPADALCVSLGLSPRLGPMADWGLALSSKQLVVDPATCQTRIPGIHAVGDVNTYPGKKKLILCGFHEATLAAHATLDRLQPDENHPLQYTTSSNVLQQRLGVAPPTSAPQ